MKSRWITYKGVQYFYLDYANYGRDVQGLLTEVNAVHSFILQQPIKSLLTLVDVRGSEISNEFLNLIKANAVTVRPHVRKMAVVGATGFRRVFAEMVIRFSGLGLTLFDDEKAAQEWLVHDNEKTGAA